MDDASFTSFYRWAVLPAVALIVCKFAVVKVISIWTAFAKIKNYPGRVPLWLHSYYPIALALRRAFPRSGISGYYTAKFSLYKKFGATCYTSVCIAPFARAQTVFWLADPEAIKLVVSDRHTFQKDVSQYGIIDIYGKNIVSAEGTDWKCHRSISMSAFNDANVALVWSEALRVTHEWFEKLDITGPDVTLDILPSMMKATLLVIATAGFGRRVSWTDDWASEPPPDCKLTFLSAVMGSVNNILFRGLTPEWVFRFLSLINVPYLSSRILFARLAFDDLRTHMLDLVTSARADITAGERSGTCHAALLRNLVKANMNEDGNSKKLTEGELLSNIFVFLLAGNETSARTLCFALILLAVYPDSQRKIYEEVIRIWPADAPESQLMTNHKHMDKLVYTMACIRETLRLFPAAPRIPKDVHTDTVLPGTYFTTGSNEGGAVETGKFSMVVPAGSTITIDVWALHMNPLCWGEDAAEFKPERFIDTKSYRWPRNAYLTFSGGARSCMGQQFALTEMVAILVSVVRRYEIRVPDDLAKKSFEEQKEILFRWTIGLTLTPVNTHLKLCRRI